MILADNAQVISNSRKIFGDDIYIEFIDSLMSFINVQGNATAHNTIKAKIDDNINSEKELIDIMMGNNIDVTFEDNNIKNIILNRMAYTMYHAIDSSLLIGINAVDGDLITLDFQDDQLYQINVKGDARGLFTPEPNNSQIDSVMIN